ncbi:MAG: hypothetical protein AAF383_27435 [Cyanobacteria bacterium P01_A01_bin.83]
MLDNNRQEIAVNPIEIPDFVNQLDYLDLLRLLVEVPNLSEWFLEQALQRRERKVGFYITRHPNITDKIKAKLIATGDGDSCLYFVQQKNLSDLLISQLAQVEVKGSSAPRNREIRKKIRLAIANKPNTELDILKQLAFDTEPSVKQAVASRHDLPIELIREMAKDRQIARKGFLVRNRSLDHDVLDTLAQDSHPKVQQLAALHPNTSGKTLVRLANSPAIASLVLQNPNLTAEIFEQLASSNNPKLHLALAQHSWTSRETLANIAAKSEDAATLIAVVENNQTEKKTKSEILNKLASFSSRSVRQYVAKNPCTPENILWGWGTSQRYYKLHPFIAKNSGSPMMLLDYLAHKFYSRKVWEGLSTNLNTSEDTFKYLYSKQLKRSILNGRKVNGIAKEHRIPFYILKKLMPTQHCGIRSAWYLLNSEEEQEITFETIDKRIKADGRYYRGRDRTYDIYLIQKCDLPPATVEFLLEGIAQSYKADRRKFVARHLKTPTSVLETLVKDEDQGVRDAAIFRLQQKQDSKLN